MKNKKKKVLVTFKVMIDYLIENKSKLPKNIDFNFVKIPQALNSKELSKKITGYDGLICGDDEVDENVVKNANKLKVISKWGTGIDSIKKELCLKNGIKVCNTPNAFTDSVAQLALSYILAFSKNIFEIHNQIKVKKKWPKISSSMMKNQYVGIIGVGKIGLKLSKLCQKLGFKILFTDVRKIKPNKYLIKTSLKNLLKKSDYICICCDLNPSSKYLLNFENLKLMKKTGSLINVARGPIIKEKDLIKFLKINKNFKVALDVFEKEPLKINSPLRKYHNVILSSHNAFNSKELVKKVNENSLSNILKNIF